MSIAKFLLFLAFNLVSLSCFGAAHSSLLAPSRFAEEKAMLSRSTAVETAIPSITEYLGSFPNFTGSEGSIEVSPDRRWIARCGSSTNPGPLQIYACGKSSEAKILAEKVSCCAWSSDSKKIAYVQSDGVCVCYDLETQKLDKYDIVRMHTRYGNDDRFMWEGFFWDKVLFQDNSNVVVIGKRGNRNCALLFSVLINFSSVKNGVCLDRLYGNSLDDLAYGLVRGSDNKVHTLVYRGSNDIQMQRVSDDRSVLYIKLIPQQAGFMYQFHTNPHIYPSPDNKYLAVVGRKKTSGKLNPLQLFIFENRSTTGDKFEPEGGYHFITAVPWVAEDLTPQRVGCKWLSNKRLLIRKEIVGQSTKQALLSRDACRVYSITDNGESREIRIPASREQVLVSPDGTLRAMYGLLGLQVFQNKDDVENVEIINYENDCASHLAWSKDSTEMVYFIPDDTRNQNVITWSDVVPNQNGDYSTEWCSCPISKLMYASDDDEQAKNFVCDNLYYDDNGGTVIEGHTRHENKNCQVRIVLNPGCYGAEPDTWQYKRDNVVVPSEVAGAPSKQAPLGNVSSTSSTSSGAVSSSSSTNDNLSSSSSSYVTPAPAKVVGVPHITNVTVPPSKQSVAQSTQPSILLHAHATTGVPSVSNTNVRSVVPATGAQSNSSSSSTTIFAVAQAVQGLVQPQVAAAKKLEDKIIAAEKTDFELSCHISGQTENTVLCTDVLGAELEKIIAEYADKDALLRGMSQTKRDGITYSQVKLAWLPEKVEVTRENLNFIKSVISKYYANPTVFAPEQFFGNVKENLLKVYFELCVKLGLMGLVEQMIKILPPEYLGVLADHILQDSDPLLGKTKNTNKAGMSGAWLALKMYSRTDLDAVIGEKIFKVFRATRNTAAKRS